MPRKTPVRELQKEEPVVSSPLRRSSRLSSSSPVPTKVLSRRNSASEAPTSTPMATRSRRSSLSQEIESSDDLQSDKKKPTSTIRTRRGSQNSEGQEELIQKPKTRGSSLPKEEKPDVKKTTRRRKSLTEDSNVDADSTKKNTRSQSGSLTNKDEPKSSNKKQQTSSIKDKTAGTPVKKKLSPKSANGSLESIKETNKEVDFSDDTAVETNTEVDEGEVQKGKRKNIEIGKIDFDLSVINEASFIEEEVSPQEKNDSVHEIESQSDKKEQGPQVKNNLDEKVSVIVEDILKNPKITPIPKDEPKSNSSVSKDNEKNEEIESSISESSFNLQLSSSALESSNKNEIVCFGSNKENVSPKASVSQPECEPMDVDDDSVFELSSPVKTIGMKTPKKSIEKEKNEIGQKLQIAEKVTDEIANFLSEEIRFTSGSEKSVEKQHTKIETEISEEKDSDLSKESAIENERSVIYLEKVADVAETSSLEKVVLDTEPVQTEPEECSKSDSKDVGTVGQTNEKKLVSPNVSKTLKKETDRVTEKSINNVERSVEIDHSSSVASVLSESEAPEESVNVEIISSKKQLEIDTPEEAENSVETKRKDANGEFVLKSENPQIGPTEPDINKLNDIQDEVVETEIAKHMVSLTRNNEENDDAVSSQEQHRNPNTSPEKTSGESDKIDHCDALESAPVADRNEQNMVPERETDSDFIEENTLRIKEKDAMSEKSKTMEQNESIILCDSEPEQEMNSDSCEGNDSYRSPVKKLRTHLSLSDDECFMRKNVKVQKSDIFDTSLDSKYSVSLRKKTRVVEKSQSHSSNEVIELSDKDEEDEIVENSDNKESTKNIKGGFKVVSTESVDIETVKNEDEITSDEAKAENSTVNTSSRKLSLDETSTSLHNIVDLFFAGLKNKSDISVKVSLESTGQDSDLEDDNKKKVIEISLSAAGKDGTETDNLKGSKRRKICHATDDVDKSRDQSTDEDIAQTPSKGSNKIEHEEKVTSSKKRKKRTSNVSDFLSDMRQSTPKYSETVDNQDRTLSAKKSKKQSYSSPESYSTSENRSESNDTLEVSSKISPTIHNEGSAKKSKKRKSAQHDADLRQLIDTSTKISVKPSVMFEVDDKSPGKTKTRRSETSEESVEKNQKKSPIKKVPATPFKLLNVSGNADVESNDATESSDDEHNDESVIFKSQDSKYDNFFSTSFGDSDANDTTWEPPVEETTVSSSDSDIDDSDADEVDDEILVEEESLVIEKKRRKGSCYSANDDVFEEATAEKEKSPGKKNARKLFRLSRYDASQAISFTDSKDNTQNKSEKSKPKSKHSEEVGSFDETNKSKTKNKKSKHTFFKKSIKVKNMLPESSEVQGVSDKNKNRKRKHLTSHMIEENQVTNIGKTDDSLSKKKMRKGVNNKSESPLQIKPSGNRRNVQALSMKPSTKATTSGWVVSTL